MLLGAKTSARRAALLTANTIDVLSDNGFDQACVEMAKLSAQPVAPGIAAS